MKAAKLNEPAEQFSGQRKGKDEGKKREKPFQKIVPEVFFSTIIKSRFPFGKKDNDET